MAGPRAQRSKTGAGQLDLPLEEQRRAARGAPDPELWQPLTPTPVFDTFWRFAAERQAVFFRRLSRPTPPWTADPILSTYKFTNAYRASDRVSQYLIRHVIYQGDQDVDEVVFRTLLFKLFNRIETWEALADEDSPTWRDFSSAWYDAALTDAAARGPVYSAAYLMPAGRGSRGSGSKHRFHLALLEQMMRDGLPARLADCSSLAKAFELVRNYEGIGDFLAYQFITDINYSGVTDHDEASFTTPGPGARDGIRKCFRELGGMSEADVIRFVTDRQTAAFDALELEFRSLWGRPLQPIDVQNLFCEVDKYARVAHPEAQGRSGRSRIKQRYRWTGPVPRPWYPPKWGLNERIAADPELGDAAP